MKKVYVLLFDGFSDWEIGFVLPEIRKAGRHQVFTVGFSTEPVTSMGGLRVVPDATLAEIYKQQTALLILPGGQVWEKRSSPEVIKLLHELRAAGVPIAAICGATLEVIRAGLSRSAFHTSNNLYWLKAMVPDYQDEALYQDQLAVSDGGLVTANAVGAVEFAREVMRELKFNEGYIEWWFQLFKHGIWTAPVHTA